jgi:hypothetical protein
MPTRAKPQKNFWMGSGSKPQAQDEQRWRCAATEGDSGPPRLLKWKTDSPRSGASGHGARGIISRGLPLGTEPQRLKRLQLALYP